MSLTYNSPGTCCGALGAIMLRNHATAVRERALGLMLDWLTRDGRDLLDKP